MNTNINKTSALISMSLANIRNELLIGVLAPSDAALASLRVARMFFTDSQLLPLTRELLGFSEIEAGIETQVIEYLDAKCDVLDHFIFKHRLVNGFRMPLFVALRQAKEQKMPSVRHEQWFCRLSAREIEEIRQQIELEGAPFTVLDCDADEYGVFVCKADAVRALYNGILNFIAQFIDCLLRQLESPYVSPDVTEPLN